MRYEEKLSAAIESDLSCMIMEFIEEHFSDEWCLDCETYKNGACAEDWWDDCCPMHTQLENTQAVVDDFAHIIMEAFNR